MYIKINNNKGAKSHAGGDDKPMFSLNGPTEIFNKSKI